MSRYIDADDITKRIQSRIGYFEMYYPNDTKNIHELKNCLEIVNDIPTADVKPIVYCKDCKFQDDIKGCIRLNVFVDKNTFYCEYAMRQESEEEV